MSEKTAKNLGSFLKNKRTSLGLSLREVESASGVSNAYLSMIERGERPAPHPRILKNLAAFYGIELGVLMKLAGYLDVVGNDNDVLEVESVFQEAMADPNLGIGHRFRGELNFEAKKVIAEMYRKYREKRSKEK